MRLLLKKGILVQKSASLTVPSPPVSSNGQGRMNSPPMHIGRSSSVDSPRSLKSPSFRIKKRNVKRIELSSSSPIKPALAKRVIRPGESSSDSDIDSLGAITWGGPGSHPTQDRSMYSFFIFSDVGCSMWKVRCTRFRR